MSEFDDTRIDLPPEAQPFDASDEVQVNNRKREAGRRKKTEGQVIKNLLSTPQGRNWMWHLLEAAHVFQQSYLQGDPYGTHFRDGERNLGLRILGEVTSVAPVLMLKEQGNG